MELKDSDPAKFAAYAQMAMDAAKLAEEQPEAYKQLFQEVATGGYRLVDTGIHSARSP